jgi:CRP-like cAMP-binding protein
MFPESLLRKHKAQLVKAKKGEPIFRQGDTATCFFIVKSGSVRMLSHNEEGKEFVQGHFAGGQSFGEPPFFNHIPYPATAEAETTCEVWRIPYDAFMTLLRNNVDILLKLTQVLSGRLIYKSMMLTEIAVEEAEHRLSTLINYFRQEQQPDGDETAYVVPFTRQQLADMTGLRVETVIRSIKLMEQKRRLTLDEAGKILWQSSK